MDEFKVTALHKLIAGIVVALLLFSLTAFSEASKDDNADISIAGQAKGAD